MHNQHIGGEGGGGALTSGGSYGSISLHDHVIKVVERQGLSRVTLPACSPLQLMCASPGVMESCADH